MSHIFISYSHKDSDYAHQLAGEMEVRGFKVWIDGRIDAGKQWPRVIQENLDICSAFVLIMTQNSWESDWVQNELARAKRKNKPIFPLLLEGQEPWLSVEATQYTDVTDKRLPPDRFYSTLKLHVPNDAEDFQPVYTTTLTTQDYAAPNEEWEQLEKEYVSKFASELVYEMLVQDINPTDAKSIRKFLDSIAVVKGIRSPQQIENAIQHAHMGFIAVENTKFMSELRRSGLRYLKTKVVINLVDEGTFEEIIDVIYQTPNDEWVILKFLPNLKLVESQFTSSNIRRDCRRYAPFLYACRRLLSDHIPKIDRKTEIKCLLFYIREFVLVTLEKEALEKDIRTLVGDFKDLNAELIFDENDHF